MNINIDDGFRFGLGLFETILVLDNKAVFLKEHLHRLQESMNYFKIQKHIDEDAFLKFLEKDQKEGKSILKATVTSENFLLERKDYHYKKKDYQEGFSLKKSFILRNETSPFTYHKTLNYGDNILEKEKLLFQISMNLILLIQKVFSLKELLQIYFLCGAIKFSPLHRTPVC